MEESEFEGTLVLEKIAGIGKIDDFFEAIDLDDFAKVKALLIKANLDFETISMVLKKMREGD